MYMERVVIHCLDTEVDAYADVAHKTDKHMRVVIEDTTVALELHRTDVRKPYIGRMAGLEFMYKPETGTEPAIWQDHTGGQG